jgi:hypothetical protein
MKIQVCENHRGSGRVTMGKSIFTCIYNGKKYFKSSLKKKLKDQFQSNLVQINIGQRQIKFIQIKGQFLIKDDKITKIG